MISIKKSSIPRIILVWRVGQIPIRLRFIFWVISKLMDIANKSDGSLWKNCLWYVIIFPNLKFSVYYCNNQVRRKNIRESFNNSKKLQTIFRFADRQGIFWYDLICTFFYRFQEFHASRTKTAPYFVDPKIIFFSKIIWFFFENFFRFFKN